MKDDMELHQIIYGVIKIQIEFGAYRSGDILPTMERAADNFLVSLDTVRSAYLRLQKEGYVTLCQNVGTMVIKDYSQQEIEGFIQLFFSRRKNALIDLSKSLRPLLGHAQWIAFKNAPGEVYTGLLQLEVEDSLKPYIAFNHLMQAYDALKNDLLLRLVWHIYMFFEAPFFAIPENPWRPFAMKEYSPKSLDFCLKQDWDSLRDFIYDMQDSVSLTLCRFYGERITMSAQQETPFTWSSYKKASQICYTLAMELLFSISRGQYPVNTLLPSLDKLSKEKQVSVSTVRRALSLLNGVGATKSFKGVGTKVLPFHETAENCDFTKPAVRKRLLDMAQSLQILTLSSKMVSELTVSALDAFSLQKCIKKLSMIRDLGQCELVTYGTLELLEQFAPYEAIRTVYGELMQQLFWGYSLRSIWKKSGDKSSLYNSCFDAFINALEHADAVLFSEKLEQLMVHEFEFTIRNLVELGINEAERLLLPDFR